jgi:hypothetical protein
MIRSHYDGISWSPSKKNGKAALLLLMLQQGKNF